MSPLVRRRGRLIGHALILAVCFALAFPIAGFCYGLAHADFGADTVDAVDALVYACVMAIQVTQSFGFLDAEPDDPLGDSLVSLYPSILAWTAGLFLATEAVLYLWRRRRRRSAARRAGAAGTDETPG